ncbi:ROK family protein [Membranihabitans maritimus]|uniref:ROK family protein n=1 Tax=Membranihabitans maritimus TaxID=2904244 RepID=UPI001F27C543|nr:ROK family protein [Membranihabitans maritimus]
MLFFRKDYGLGKDKIYKKKIIKQLYFNEILSCTEISEKINKSIPFTTRIIDKLIEEGTVRINGLATSTGGRKPKTYSLVTQKMYVAAMAIDQVETRMVISDLGNSRIIIDEVLPLTLLDNDKALKQITHFACSVLEKSNTCPDKLVGLGISMPGFINVKKGINHSFIPTNGVNIVDHLSSAVNTPVYIGNDSSLVALGELRFGAAQNSKNVMTVNIGWGVGLGMILKGQLFSGENGYAGELSHIPLFDNQKICECGKTGCLETEASLYSLIEKAKARGGEEEVTTMEIINLQKPKETIYHIFKYAQKGDRFAISLLSEMGYKIGRGLAILIHLMNPELIILSGIGAQVGRLWEAPMQQAINEHCIPKLSENTQLVVSDLKDRAALIGAASLVMDNYGK